MEHAGLGIPLGPFEIQERLGSGGMARVWRGVHRQQQVPVAIKVMDGQFALQSAYRSAFREEIRAIAGFHHPGIIWVFDHGTISRETSDASNRALPHGAPYLAMELASGGSLRDMEEALSWTQLRSTLVSLLDALAHAHARGVIHRDLKPTNVLLCTAADSRPGLKLTDFGLAHAMEAEAGATKLSGTPRYMAPEQFQGRWRDYGPWTDLYALGVVAWELSAGRVPFPARDVESLAAAHLTHDPPRHYPRRTVPDGFEAWLLRLLEKEPHRRFRRASDATAALMALPEVTEADDVVYQAVPTLISNPTIALDTVFLKAADSHTMSLDNTFGDLDPVTADQAVVDPVESQAPPQPTTWRRPTPPAPSIQLVGAGLGLYGLRSIPLVNRDRERDAIWTTLRQVRAENQPRAILLRGAAGNGKSRLVEWMGERAHELGAATVVRAVHSPRAGGADGIVRMIARQLRTHNLSDNATRRRVHRALHVHGHYGDWEVDALTDMLQTGSRDTPNERYVLIQRHLARLAQERPVLLWLDDVQWGGDALSFVRFLVEQPEAGAILVVMTAQEEALAERVLEAEQLSNLMEALSGETLPIGPLAPAYRAELVERLLNLEGELARQVEERTGGNPLFAVQLVGDWVQRGELVPGETGFRLRDGARESLPDGLHEVWARKVGRVLDALEPDARAALEVAAALGQEVDKEEWAAACARLEVPPAPELLARLASQRLAAEDESSWWFVHGMLRESVERLSQEGGRWKRLNRACAEMLEPRSGEPGVPGRLGQHWLQAGRPIQALAPLLAGAGHHSSQSEGGPGLALLDLFDRAVAAADLPPTDPRRVDGLISRTRLLLTSPYNEEALKAADIALAAAKGRPRREAEALLCRASAISSLGRTREALEVATAASEAFRTLGDADGYRRARRRMAGAEMNLGELDAAEERLMEIQLDCRASGDMPMYGMILGDQADVERLRENWSEAADLYRRAMATARRTGNRKDYAHQLHGLAEVSRLNGRLDEAEALYKEFLDIQLTRGVTGIQMAHFNLGLIALARGQYSQARTLHEKVRGVWDAGGATGYVGLVDLALLASYAALEDWFFWPTTLRSAKRAIETSGMVDVDLAIPAELAGDLAAERGAFREAIEAWEIARDQWTALHKPAKASAIQRRIDVSREP